MIIPVILSGGAGTRLWPVSREGHPKPFMSLPDGETLLFKTYTRAAEIAAKEGDIVTVTNRDYYFQSKDQFEEAQLTQNAHFILEPQGRNTAPAIAVAATILSEKFGKDAIMVVMPADHLIKDHAAFKASVNHAVTLAREGHLVTFGIPPTTPETGFGYLENDFPLDDFGGKHVKRFIEKPDVETARQYVASGNFLWNSGMFCFSVGTFLDELAEHAPLLLEQAIDCVQASPSHNNGVCEVQELAVKQFSAMPNISVDYALMEHSTCVASVPGTFDWSDIGSWSAMRQLVEPDDNGNRAIGNALFVDSSNTYIQNEGRFVAAVGINDLIIVDTADAVLVAHADHVQEVRKVVAQLKNDAHEAYRLHRTVNRPWGTYTVLEEEVRYKIKRIVVKPGGKLSLQMHHHRSEHWVIVQGMARVTNNGDGARLVNCNESTFIPAGHKHRLENPGMIDLVMIEVQSGEYLGEDDIVRFEDQYGRTR